MRWIEPNGGRPSPPAGGFTERIRALAVADPRLFGPPFSS